MYNLIQLAPSNEQTSSILNEYDVEQTDEARLLADFTQLVQQYRRAGYEYYQRTQQSDSGWADLSAEDDQQTS